jgi:hypothetical protein
VADGQDPPLPVPGNTPEPGYQGGAEFFIDFDTAPGLGKMLDQASEYGVQCERFIRDHAAFKGGEGWFNQLNGKHDAVVEQAASWFKKLADPVLSTTASHVGATIRLFEHTEAANAAAIDHAVPSRIDTVDVSLPAWPKSGTEVSVPYGPFEYIEDPAEALGKLHDYEGDPSLAYHPQIWDLVSPAGAARATFVKVTEFLAWLGFLDRPYDPYDVFVKPVVGDWAGMRRFADVLRKAADASERTGIGIDRARHMLGPVWRGRAADACVVWLGAVAKPMRDSPNALDKLADAYERAAQGAAQFRALLDDILTSCIDEVFFIAGALAIGGGGAAATGGISAGVAAVVAGAAIYKLVDGISALIKAADATSLIVDGVGAAMNDFGSLQAGGQLPHLPPVSGDASAISVLPS